MLLKCVVSQEHPEQRTVVAKYFRATRVNGEYIIRCYIRRASPRAAVFDIFLFVISPPDNCVKMCYQREFHFNGLSLPEIPACSCSS